MATTLADIVAYIRGDNDDLKQKLGESERASQSAGANMAKFLGGAIVGGAALAGAAIIGIGGKAFDVASDIDAATDQIGASLGLTDSQAKAFGETIKQVYGNNFGDSIEDVGTAVETVAKQLQLAADDPALPKMTENAFRLRDVFNVEVNDSVDAVKTLMENFGVTGEEAFDLIATGYQRGLDRSGDFLDTIGEYSVQFSNGGASASDFFKLLEEGMQGGMLGTDKAADAFKEFGIRILDDSKLTKDSLAAIGISYDQLSQGFADGSTTSIDAMREVLYQIFQIEDPIQRATIGVGLFGTQWEDLGESTMKAIAEIEEGFGVQEGAIDSLDTKYTSLGGVVEGMWRKFQVGIAPAGEAMLTFVNDNLPAIEGVVNTVSGAVVTFIGLIPLALTGIKTAWDENWGGMRDKAEEFMTLDQDFETFWQRVNNSFNQGEQDVSHNWAEWLANTLGVFTSWVRFALDTVGIFFDNWKRTQDAWHALLEGDWSAFWINIGGNFEGAMNILLNFLEFVFGPSLRNSLVEGLNDMWDGAKDKMKEIQDWWQNVWVPFRNMLPFSEPKDPRSPLRGLGQSGEAMIGNFQEGMERGMSNLMGGFTSGLGQFAAGGNTNYEIHVNAANASYQAGYSHGEGVLDAMRYRGG